MEMEKRNSGTSNVRSLLQLCKVLRLQLFIVCLVTCIYILIYIGVIPEIQKLAELLSSIFEKNGLLVIVPCAFVENIGGLNVYFPGSIVILTGMALTAGKPILALITFFCISIPSILAHVLNYFIGAGIIIGRKSESEKGNNYPTIWKFFAMFWHPHLAALVCLESGSARMPFKKFLSVMLPSAIFWYILWAIIMYSAGYASASPKELVYLFLAYLALWTYYDAYRYWHGSQRNMGRP